jgi:hypothetical protein
MFSAAAVYADILAGTFCPPTKQVHADYELNVNEWQKRGRARAHMIAHVPSTMWTAHDVQFFLAIECFQYYSPCYLKQHIPAHTLQHTAPHAACWLQQLTDTRLYYRLITSCGRTGRRQKTKADTRACGNSCASS